MSYKLYLFFLGTTTIHPHSTSLLLLWLLLFHSTYYTVLFALPVQVINYVNYFAYSDFVAGRRRRMRIRLTLGQKKLMCVFVCLLCGRYSPIIQYSNNNN